MGKAPMPVNEIASHVAFGSIFSKLLDLFHGSLHLTTKKVAAQTVVLTGNDSLELTGKGQFPLAHNYNPKRLSLFLDCSFCPISLHRELGIGTLAKCKNEKKEMLRLASTLFDTRLVDGVTMMQPFADDATIKRIAVKVFPEELFSVLRTVHLLRGLSVGLGITYSCAEQWRPIAEEALRSAGRLQDKLKTQRRGFLRRTFRRHQVKT